MDTPITHFTVNSMPEKSIPEHSAILTPRETFIQAGIHLMKAEGPDSLSLNRILAQAKKPRGSFYAAFESKEAYLAQLISHYFKPPTDVLAIFAAGASTGSHDTLRAWASWCVQRLMLASGGGDRTVSLTEMAGRSLNPSVTAEICEGLFHERTVALGKILSAAQFLPGSEAEVQASLLLAMLDGVEARASATQNPRLIEQFFNYFFKHLT